MFDWRAAAPVAARFLLPPAHHQNWLWRERPIDARLCQSTHETLFAIYEIKL